MFIKLINNIKINNYQLNYYAYSTIMFVNDIIVYVLVFFH